MRHCGVVGCKGGVQTLTLPNPEKKFQHFKQWLILMGREDLLRRDAKRVHSSCRVCKVHFRDSAFRFKGPYCCRLRNDAVPELFLPDRQSLGDTLGTSSGDLHPSPEVTPCPACSQITDPAGQEEWAYPVGVTPCKRGQVTENNDESLPIEPPPKDKEIPSILPNAPVKPASDRAEPVNATEALDNVADLDGTPQPSIAKVLSASQIDEMFEITETPVEGASVHDETNDDEQSDLSPRVTADDIKAVQEEVREVDVLVCGSCHIVFHFIEEFKMHKPECKKKLMLSKAVQEGLREVDVLVCGSCHIVFHFIEEFKKHKPECKKKLLLSKAVQEEVREVDVLVCGSCHLVFHFVKEFKMHKPECKKKSDFHGNIVETKPQVWAFLLWKNALSKVDKHGAAIEESSWKLYQKWCKMSEVVRNSWVAAGETVMNLSSFGYAKPMEPATKPLLPKKLDSRKDNNDGEHKPVILKELVQRDAACEIKSAPGIKKKFNDDAESIRHQLEDGDSSQDREIHSFPSGQEEEFVVEKIVSRRFNPRKKQYEYLLKWEGYPPEQNTWEPAENLETCLHLLKAFEESLAKKSLNKQKMGYKQKVDHKNSSSGSSSFSNYEGRPIRYSKQKALKQVKQWCGSIKPDDAELEMLKRKMPEPDSDDDDDDPCIKKKKLEGGRDSEDSIGAAKYCIQIMWEERVE